MTNQDETVAVPVLREALKAELGWTEQEIDEFMAERLNPKPKPRLVAVNLDDYANDEKVAVYEMNHWPDLLALIDEALRPVMLDDRGGVAMSRIRVALGVTE